MADADTKLAEVVDLLRELVDAAKPSPALIGLKDLARLMALGESTFERLKATPEIGPQPVRIGGSLRWERAEVNAWLRHRTQRGDLYDAKTWPAVWKQIGSS